jgi:hypothetical protein
MQEQKLTAGVHFSFGEQAAQVKRIIRASILLVLTNG